MKTINKKTTIMTSLIAMSAILLTSAIFPALTSQQAFAGVTPVEGDELDIFDSTQRGVGLGFDGEFLYVPAGIDATQLRVFDTDGNEQAPLALGCTVGNISYDPVRDVFWAYDMVGATAPVYTIDPSTGNCTLEFDAYTAMVANGACGAFCDWPADGIDYDERDDTIRISPDASTIIYNFATDGTYLSQIGPIDTFDECGRDFSSGVGTGASNVMYTAGGGCSEIHKWDKDTGNSLGSFDTNGIHNEAIECDSVTFTDQGVDALWVKDLDGMIQAFAVPAGTCEINPIPDVEKIYTFTNNNWDLVCDGFFNETSTLCEVSEVDNTELGFREANINTEDVFAMPLPDTDGTYELLGDQKGNKKTVVNPGQYIQATSITVQSQQDVWFNEDVASCSVIGTINPNKVPGGVQVVRIDGTTGDVFDIDDDLALGIGGSLTLNGTLVEVHVDDVPAGDTIRVMVKFQPSNEINIIGESCTLTSEVLNVHNQVINSASADLTIIQK